MPFGTYLDGGAVATKAFIAAQIIAAWDRWWTPTLLVLAAYARRGRRISATRSSRRWTLFPWYQTLTSQPLSP